MDDCIKRLLIIKLLCSLEKKEGVNLVCEKKVNQVWMLLSF